MTRIVFIEAGPTPWDAEDRIVGNQSLPNTKEIVIERVSGNSSGIE